MQRTHIVGTRKAYPLATLRTKIGAPAQVAPVQVPVVAKGTMFYVCNKGAASKLQGYNSVKCNNYTCYAVFNTHAQAVAHMQKNRMYLYACIVAM